MNRPIVAIGMLAGALVLTGCGKIETLDQPAPLYGAKLLHTFFREHSKPAADPIVRRRLRELVNSCSAMKAELRLRAEAMGSGDEQPPTKAREHADLIAHTFATA